MITYAEAEEIGRQFLANEDFPYPDYELQPGKASYCQELCMEK